MMQCYDGFVCVWIVVDDECFGGGGVDDCILICLDCCEYILYF